MSETTQIPPSGLLRRYTRMLRFATVGAFATLAYVVIATSFHAMLPFSAALSSGLAYAICAIGSYLGHQHFTFRTVNHEQRSSSAFFLLSFFGYALSMLVPAIVSDWLEWPRLVSTVLTSIIIPVSSALLTSRLAFGVSLLEAGKSPQRADIQGQSPRI